MRTDFLLRRQSSLAFVFLALVAESVFCPQSLLSQYRKFSVTASVGYSSLNLGEVDNKNQSDVFGWTDQGVPVSQFGSLKQSPFYSAGVSYRLDRELGFSLTWSYWRKSVSAAYSGSASSLSLDRGVGSTDYTLGISYYPDIQFSFFEWYCKLNLDLEYARATASAEGTQTFNISGVLLSMPLVETEALYKKRKTALSLAVGADVPIIRHVFVNAEAAYRFAQLGNLEGDITQFGESSVETSSVAFDFSGFLVGAGLRIEF